MSQESVLETQSLEKWFGGVRAVAGVDFNPRNGRLFEIRRNYAHGPGAWGQLGEEVLV